MVNPLQGLVDTIDAAISMAVENKHQYVTLEHLVYATLEDTEVKTCLSDLQINDAPIRESLDIFFNDSYIATTNSKPIKTDEFDIVVTHAVGLAMFEFQPSSALRLLMHILRHPIPDSEAMNALLRTGLSAGQIERYLERDLLDQMNTSSVFEDADIITEQFTPPATRVEAEKVIHRFCSNLNEQAMSNKIDPLIGRLMEIEETVQTMCRRTKNNIVFVGEPGVGKTAIAEGLALRVVKKDVPEALLGATIYSLDVAALVAGTRYRGDFEERMKVLLKSLEMIKGAVLFIDEIHMIMNAGSSGAMDLSNMLKPALARGALRCIGSTTLEEFRKYFEKDRALLRRFRRLDIKEPSPEDTKLILKGLKATYEGFHKISVDDDAIDAAVDLSVRYVTKGFLPDKAIDILDSTFARAKLAPIKQRSERITAEDIEAEVARIVNIPKQEVSDGDSDRLRRLEAELLDSVYDQNAAIKTLVGAVYVARAGLRDADKPIGSYLFTGPTGTGKTETAKQLAKTLGIPILRFDMSEYMERHSISRLIGAPPGYVGFDQGGLLTDAIDQHPHCVLLLDEIEKAHPELYSILLQVMDHGKLTDHNGKQIDFRNVYLIMTSNVGSADAERSRIGFGKTENSIAANTALKCLFTPEFRNRLDAVVAFGKLKPETLRRIVIKNIAKLEEQALSRKVALTLGDDAVEWLMTKGYDPTMGARPMARVITDHIKTPLAGMMLVGDLRKGGKAHVTVVDGALSIAS